MTDSPGRYGKHATPRDDRDELTQQTLAALEKLAAEDRAHLVTKLTMKSSPPREAAKHPAWQMAQSVIVAVIVAALGAALVLWRNDAVTQERQATTDRRIDGALKDVREHEQLGSHPGTQAGLARIDAKLDALSVRLERIERQMDSTTRRPR